VLPVLPLMPEDSLERLALTSTLNAIASARTVDELKLQTRRALSMYLPCENFVFASGRVRAHRVFISNLVNADAVSDDYLRSVVDSDGMIPPVGIDLIEHCGRPKFTTVDRLENPIERVWADIFTRHGISNIAWMILPGLHRNSFIGYFFQNTSTAVTDENKLRMIILAPYLHIALNRLLGVKLLNDHCNDKASTQFLSILSSREAEISRWVARGKTNWEIGQILGISDKTVKTHMQNILGKLKASSRAQIAALFSDE